MNRERTVTVTVVDFRTRVSRTLLLHEYVFDATIGAITLKEIPEKRGFVRVGCLVCKEQNPSRKRTPPRAPVGRQQWWVK